MHVNNEIGSIQPVRDIIKTIRGKSRRIKVHIDGVQSAGKLSINVKELDADMMSLSAHKIHGPKGTGALYMKKGLSIRSPMIGGGQERGMRSGTENLPGICGFGVAANAISQNIQDKSRHIHNVKSHFVDRLGEKIGRASCREIV